MFQTLQLETTTFCNASCGFCPNVLLAKHRHMDLDLIYRVLDQCAPYVKTVRPFGLGEPFVDPRLPKILAYIKENTTAKVELHTNAEPLTENKEQDVVGLVDLIRFSLDGLTPATVGSVRNINGARAVANTERFIRANPEVECEVRMVALADNGGEQEAFLQYWNDVRPGCAKVTELYNHPWEGQTASTGEPCTKCQDEAFVYVDGSVHPCPWDFGERAVLGNVKVDNITEIWRSHKVAQFRADLAHGRRHKHELCSRCDATF